MRIPGVHSGTYCSIKTSPARHALRQPRNAALLRNKAAFPQVSDPYISPWWLCIVNILVYLLYKATTELTFEN